MNIQPPLQQVIDALKAIKLKELERTEELGRDYSFKQAVDFIRKIYSDLTQVIENAELLRVSTNTEQRIINLANRVNEYVKQIQNFVLKGNEPNAPNQHQQINNGVASLYQEDLDLLPPLIERVNILKLNPEEVENKVAKALRSIKEIEQIKNEAQKTKENINVAIKEVRDALGREGALISATDFEKQAAEHKALAKKWFWGAIGSIFATAILVVILFSGLLSSLNLTNVGNDYPRIVQITVFKIILLSIAYLLVYQSIKNYKVNEHLYVLNRHRQLTLSVYPLMAKATNEQEQSNAIVAQAAKAIFDPGTTGYLDGDDNPNPVNLTEIINRVVDKK
jgi:ABC-type multidrug transport system fused ATPase/permease subunit